MSQSHESEGTEFSSEANESQIPCPPKPDLRLVTLHELYRLMSAWADGNLSDFDFALLDYQLKNDAAARQAFSRFVRICQSLPELVVPAFDPLNRFQPHSSSMQDTEQDTEFSDTQTSRSEKLNSYSSEVQSPQIHGHGKKKQVVVSINKELRTRDGVYTQRSVLSQLSRRKWLFASSVLLIVLLTFAGIRNRSPNEGGQSITSAPPSQSSDENRLSAPPAPEYVANSVDSHLAVVTNTDSVVWETGELPVEIGAALGAQVLRIASGTIEFEFACGAVLKLQGPAEFSLLSKSRGKLYFGELAAQVPEQGHGFIIDTPSVEVVDLGTEFSVTVDRSGTSDVHVFRGLVETRKNSHNEQPGILERLSTDQTRRFVPDQPQSQVLRFDHSKFPTPPIRKHGEPVTDGAVCLLRELPKSLAVGALESNEFILLMEERKNVLLPRPVPVSLSLPGRYDQFRNKDGKLRPNQRVDSYLLHFDALTTSQNYSHLRLDGSVTFDQPILGVIAVGSKLSLSDPLFGSPDVIQSDARSRGLDRNGKGNNRDIVTISSDRRTLHVSFSVGGSCDQLRILVSAETKSTAE